MLGTTAQKLIAEDFGIPYVDFVNLSPDEQRKLVEEKAGKPITKFSRPDPQVPVVGNPYLFLGRYAEVAEPKKKVLRAFISGMKGGNKGVK